MVPCPSFFYYYFYNYRYHINYITLDLYFYFYPGYSALYTLHLYLYRRVHVMYYLTCVHMSCTPSTDHYCTCVHLLHIMSRVYMIHNSCSSYL